MLALGNKRCARSSTGVTTFSSTTSAACSTACQSSQVDARLRLRAPSAPMTTSRLTTSATLSHGLPKSRSSASCTTKTVAARGVECFRRLWSTGANVSPLQVRRRVCTRRIPATSRTSHSRVQRHSAANGSAAGCAPSAPTSRTSELRSIGRSHEKMPTRRLLSSARWVGTGGSPGAPAREVVGCVSPWSALGGCRRGISRACSHGRRFSARPASLRGATPTTPSVRKERAGHSIRGDRRDRRALDAGTRHVPGGRRRRRMAWNRNPLAVAYSTAGDQTRVRELLLDAERLLDERDDARSRALQTYVRARRAFAEDRFDDAEADFRASIGLFVQVDAEVYSAFANDTSLVWPSYAATTRRASTRSRPHCARRATSAFLPSQTCSPRISAPSWRGAATSSGRARSSSNSWLPPDIRSLPGIGESLTGLAFVEWLDENDQAAERYAAEAIEVLVALDNTEAITHCLAILGLVAERRGDPDEASCRHLRGLALGAGKPRRVALLLQGLAGVALLEHDGRDAARLLGAADASSTVTGTRGRLGIRPRRAR